jgi:electron transfer flavoprotein beta subunit
VSYNCVVLVKQVPDTQRITGQAMNEDGTVNRAALPAIFNPEDLNALELAMQIKDQYGGKVTVITMGLPAASEVLRQSLYRGADEAILITDPRCAASDTLATSYILSCAVRRLPFDLVLCGRQAIDGDTAQVGPQTAEKLGIPQVSYVESLLGIEGKTITLRRNLGNGFQEVRGKLPILLTVIGEANEPRVAGVKRLMKYKKARTKVELPKESAEAQYADLTARGLAIRQWDLDTIQADLAWCGRDGSPTKVHRIQSVVLTAKDTKQIPATQDGIAAMVHELIVDHTLG